MEIKQEGKKSLGRVRGVSVPSIVNMPGEVKHSTFPPRLFEHTTVAAANKCHSALHLPVNNGHAMSVSQSVGWEAQSTDCSTDAAPVGQNKRRSGSE